MKHIGTFFCRYTYEEMRRLPLHTILDYEYLLPPKREFSPPPILIDKSEIAIPNQTAEASQEVLTTVPNFPSCGYTIIPQLSQKVSGLLLSF